MNVVLFVCTDRGQHDPIEIGYSPAEWPRIVRESFHNAITQRGASALAERRREYPIMDTSTAMRGIVTEFHCPGCPRNPQRNMFQLAQEIEAFDAGGMSEVDISRLPY